MDVYAYGRMRPLYEAMTVCSVTIVWLDGREKERNEAELQNALSKLVQVIEEFTRAASSGDLLAGAPTETILGSVYCLETLNAMTQIISSQTLTLVPKFAERFREPIRALLGQVESLTERVEGILEAWQIALDPGISGKLKTAVDHVDRSKTDIPDWREALELIHD